MELRDIHIRKEKIIHFHNYPRCPKMNAFIERFNRAIQEESIDWQRQLLANDLKKFNLEPMDWLLWYNNKRPRWLLVAGAEIAPTIYY